MAQENRDTGNGLEAVFIGPAMAPAGLGAQGGNIAPLFPDDFPEPFAAGCMQLPAVTAPFHMDACFHHRDPPNSPRLHSSPRRYCCSQDESFCLFRRSIAVCPERFPQIITASGLSLIASTRMSEWVVTISCVRWEASTSRSATLGRISG